MRAYVSAQRNDVNFRQSSSGDVQAQPLFLTSTFPNKMSDYKGASVIFTDIPKEITSLIWPCQ